MTVNKTVEELSKMHYVDYIGGFSAYYDGKNYFNSNGEKLPYEKGTDIDLVKDVMILI